MPERHTMEPEEMMAYLDGELAGERAAEAMAHLERCEECQGLAADLRRVSSELAKWQVEAPSMEAPAAKRQWWLRRLPRPFAIAALAAASALIIAMVIPRPRVSDVKDSSVGWDPIAGAAPQQEVHAVPKALPPQTRVAATAPFAAAPPASAPMIERSAQLTVIPRDFAQIRPSLDAIVTRHRGYLADLTLNAPENSGRSLDASLRVPAAEMDATLNDLKQLGRVASESQKGEDVTRQYADLTARLANARNTESRLSQLLAQRTGKLSDVLDFEREIARVRGEIEQMDAERRATETLVAYATVQLTASENYQAPMKLGPESTLARLRNAAVEGYKNVAGSVLDVGLVLITYGPVLALWGGLALMAGLWIRRRRRG